MVILKLDEQPPVVQAIFSRNIDEVKTLLAIKQDVNYLDSERRSLLHAAAYMGDVDIAALLLFHGARVNAKDNRWLTPLHRACCTGCEDIVALLLRHQADTTARDRDWQTPLHIAAANNAYDCVIRLLSCVPNPNVTDRSGKTALHHAALNGHNEVLELLISKGCIVNACDKRECRPIHCAAHMNHASTIELLLRNGADINTRDRNQYSPLHVAAASGMFTATQLLLSTGAQVDIRNSYGNTPLHVACLNGHLNICKELLDYKADIECTNYRGQTPLHIAATSTHGVECLNFLLELNVDINKQSLDGRTPLHMTAIHGRFTRSKTLIDKGAIVNCQDKNNCTALHIAAQYGHDLLSNTLLLYGADPSTKGFEGRTPLHMSCLSGYVECCRKFVQAGVNLDCVDDSGKTAVHCAAYRGSVECVDLLVSVGAKFQLLDNVGRTPLHYAAVRGHYQCVFTLVGLGSSVNLQDSDGCSSLHLASAYDLEGRCVEYLLQHKADAKLRDNSGYTAIHYAAAGENFSGLGYLLTSIGNNYIMYGCDMPPTTPLHLAARHGNLDILRLLLPYYHDVNIRTACGSTPLLLAAKQGHTHCVQMLLRFGAKVAICDTVYNMSPVHYSAKNGHMHCLALLLDNTEDQNVIDLQDSLHRTALMLSVAGGHTESALTLLKSGADPNLQDVDKHSALFRAVVGGHNKAVQLLVKFKAEVGVVDVHGKTVLHLASACGQLESLQLVLSYMTNDEAKALDNQQCTALHWACYNGNPSCVHYLLDRPVFNEMYGNSFSPIHCAVYAGSEKCIELLINTYGPEIVQLKDSRNRTPLHIAALHGHTECARYLLEQGAEIDYQDADGRTALIAAAQNGQSQVIEILLNHKVDLTSYDVNGNTALHLACLKKHSHSALLLLENIDDRDIVNMVNNDRRTALHLAARNGLVDVTKQLIHKGSSVLIVDASGMTPALCCAPNNSVAQCLAIILGNYPKISSFNSLSNKNVLFNRNKSSEQMKTYQKKLCQTHITLLRDPDHFECEQLFNIRPFTVTTCPDLETVQSKLVDAPKSKYAGDSVRTKNDSDLANNSKTDSMAKVEAQNTVEQIRRMQNPEHCFIIETYLKENAMAEESLAKRINYGLKLHKSHSDMAIADEPIYSDDHCKNLLRDSKCKLEEPTDQQKHDTDNNLVMKKSEIPKRVSDRSAQGAPCKRTVPIADHVTHLEILTEYGCPTCLNEKRFCLSCIEKAFTDQNQEKLMRRILETPRPLTKQEECDKKQTILDQLNNGKTLDDVFCLIVELCLPQKACKQSSVIASETDIGPDQTVGQSCTDKIRKRLVNTVEHVKDPSRVERDPKTSLSGEFRSTFKETYVEDCMYCAPKIDSEISHNINKNVGRLVAEPQCPISGAVKRSSTVQAYCGTVTNINQLEPVWKKQNTTKVEEYVSDNFLKEIRTQRLVKRPSQQSVKKKCKSNRLQPKKGFVAMRPPETKEDTLLLINEKNKLEVGLKQSSTRRCSSIVDRPKMTKSTKKKVFPEVATTDSVEAVEKVDREAVKKWGSDESDTSIKFCEFSKLISNDESYCDILKELFVKGAKFPVPPTASTKASLPKLKVLDTCSSDEIVNVDSIIKREQILEEELQKAELARQRFMRRKNIEARVAVDQIFPPEVLHPDVDQPKNQDVCISPSTKQMQYYTMIEEGTRALSDTNYFGSFAEYIQLIGTITKTNPECLPDVAKSIQHTVQKIRGHHVLRSDGTDLKTARIKKRFIDKERLINVTDFEGVTKVIRKKKIEKLNTLHLVDPIEVRPQAEASSTISKKKSYALRKHTVDPIEVCPWAETPPSASEEKSQFVEENTSDHLTLVNIEPFDSSSDLNKIHEVAFEKTPLSENFINDIMSDDSASQDVRKIVSGIISMVSHKSVMQEAFVDNLEVDSDCYSFQVFQNGVFQQCSDVSGVANDVSVNAGRDSIIGGTFCNEDSKIMCELVDDRRSTKSDTDVVLAGEEVSKTSASLRDDVDFEQLVATPKQMHSEKKKLRSENTALGTKIISNVKIKSKEQTESTAVTLSQGISDMGTVITDDELQDVKQSQKGTSSTLTKKKSLLKTKDSTSCIIS